MKFEVKNRWTDKVQFVADIECDDNASLSVKFGLSVKWAILSGANLRDANLYGANLYGADLYGAKNIPAITLAQTLITPEGDIIGWKKCMNDVIVKLLIPAEAKRHNATGRKCRAQFADVLEVIGSEAGVSQHDGKTEYRAGQRVTCDNWCEDRFNECSGGIHFFITRAEAEDYLNANRTRRIPHSQRTSCRCSDRRRTRDLWQGDWIYHRSK